MTDPLDAVLERSRALGFLGPGPIDAQRGHALAFLEAIDPAGVALAVDLGSGGGVPGLVLAMALADVQWVLLDAMQRRTRFLTEAVEELGLGGRVTVLTARAEDAGRTELRGTADLVVARGFGPPAVTAECGAPLLAPAGQLIVSEPPGSTGGRWPEPGLAQLGLELEALLAGPPSFVRLRRVGEVADSFPRRVGVPERRPLFHVER